MQTAAVLTPFPPRLCCTCGTCGSRTQVRCRPDRQLVGATEDQVAVVVGEYLKTDLGDTDVACVWCKRLVDASNPWYEVVDAMAVGATNVVVAEVRAYEWQ